MHPLVILCLVVAYVIAMGLALVKLGPLIVVAVAVAGTAAVPVVYGIVVFSSFDRPRWRRIFWAPVMALLGLIGIDFVYIALRWIATSLDVDASFGLLDPIVFDVPGNRLGLETWSRLLGSTLTWWAAVLSGTVPKAMAIAALLFAVRGAASHDEDPEHPAYRQYFYGEALRDFWKLVGEVFGTVARWLVACHRFIAELHSESKSLWVVIPLTITAYLAAIIPAVTGAFALVLLLGMHFVGVGAVWLANRYLSWMLAWIERAVMLARSGYVKCPACYEPAPLPHFFCSCGAVHEKLLPGRCGLFFRACSCGRSRLPTTYWLGKARLPSMCPNPECRCALDRELFGGDVHLPIYGDTSAGKTMFMTAATWQLMEEHPPGLKVDFVSATDRANYATHWKHEFESGQLRPKTNDRRPKAFLLSLRRKLGLTYSLYLYDPAGESLTGPDIHGHRFLEHSDGIVLLIDPLSIDTVARHYEQEVGPVPPTTSPVDPCVTAEFLITRLESERGRRRGLRMRLSVVFTKTDLPSLQQVLGVRLSDARPAERWRDAGTHDDAALRAWVHQHLARLAQMLETRFAEVRYFAASALGAEPRAGVGFRPKQVLDPIFWLLASHRPLAQPLSGAFLGRALELAAATAVLLVFLAPPAFAVAAALYAVETLASAPERHAAAWRRPSAGPIRAVDY